MSHVNRRPGFVPAAEKDNASLRTKRSSGRLRHEPERIIDKHFKALGAGHSLTLSTVVGFVKCYFLKVEHLSSYTSQQPSQPNISRRREWDVQCEWRIANLILPMPVCHNHKAPLSRNSKTYVISTRFFGRQAL